MKKIVCLLFALVLVIGMTAVTAFAKSYTAFDLVFEEKAGEKVNATEIKIFASVDEEEKLADRTSEFTLEGVEWFKYLPTPADGKTAEDYEYVDEELGIYGMLCTDEDVFDFDTYSYFLRIARLYAQEEDSFDRNVKINGVDIEEMNGICYNTGNEFFIKTVTNGQGGPSGEGDVTEGNGEQSGNNGEEEPARNKCRVCGICPIQPLGICLFIWIAILLIVVILVIVLIAKGKKKDDKKEDKKDAE